MAPVVEKLPSKYKALISNLSTIKQSNKHLWVLHKTPNYKTP
jgi:hypothetical protein